MFTFHVFFLSKLLDGMFYQKERVNKTWKTWNSGKRVSVQERGTGVLTTIMNSRYILIIM